MGGLATYDANDRPVLFEQEGGVTAIHCEYDYRGRRWEKKVVVNGEVTRHARYIYRGYLQLGEVDLLNQVELVRKYVWDPTEPVATKLLSGDFVLEGRDTPVTVYYAHDRQKNVTSFFNGSRERRGWYEYMPFGTLRMLQEEMGFDNKFRFSNEYMDDETGLIYYNYRYYNPVDGRWMGRDSFPMDYNCYSYISNGVMIKFDFLGLSEKKISEDSQKKEIDTNTVKDIVQNSLDHEKGAPDIPKSQPNVPIPITEKTPKIKPPKMPASPSLLHCCWKALQKAMRSTFWAASAVEVADDGLKVGAGMICVTGYFSSINDLHDKIDGKEVDLEGREKERRKYMDAAARAAQEDE